MACSLECGAAIVQCVWAPAGLAKVFDKNSRLSIQNDETIRPQILL